MAGRTQSSKYDVVILGAGAAGLAAARQLSREGLNIVVLEARNRIGGRILTHVDPTLTVPIELGAEFVHGAPKETLELCDENGLGLYDVLDSHFMKGSRGKLKASDHNWEQVQRVFARLKPERAKDRSIAEFLKTQAGRESLTTLGLVKSYAEGFHAGDVDALSEVGLAHAEQATPESSGELDHSGIFRIFDGYHRIPEILYAGIRSPDSVVKLNRVAEKILWSSDRSSGGVEITAHHRLTSEREIYSARTLVCTLPVGVLASSAGPEFSPVPKNLERALTSVRMGSAARITLKFRKRFWEGRGPEPIGMIHGKPSAMFPTWWTSQPIRAPLITGWAGGPKALEVYSLPVAKRIEVALESLGELFDLSVRQLSRDLQSAHHHDWQNDIFSRGAYSWIAVDGFRDAESFQRPVSKTLYFAGEATNNTAARGTVDGAIASGVRAARQILRDHWRERDQSLQNR